MAGCGCDDISPSVERRTLLILLWINAAMFVAEAAAGWLADSTGLIADSLDMLADASVYGIALYAVGRSPLTQYRAGAASGYVQIILGALLRHPGTGIDLGLAGIHIFWGCVVLGLVATSSYVIHSSFRDATPIRRARDAMLGLLTVQFVLGLTAFFVLLDEAGVVQPSNLQVVANTSHMVIGAMLMASAVVVAAWSIRLGTRTSPAASSVASATPLSQPV